MRKWFTGLGRAVRDLPSRLGRQAAGIKRLPAKIQGKLFKRQDTLPVVRKLRRRLTGVLLAITGLVLAAVVGFGVYFSAGQLENAAQASFDNEAITAVYELVYNQQEDAVKASLEALESNAGSVVFASVNGEDIDFAGQTDTRTERSELYGYAMDALYSEELDWENSNTVIGIFVMDSAYTVTVEDAGEGTSATLAETEAVEDAAETEREWDSGYSAAAANAETAGDSNYEDALRSGRVNIVEYETYNGHNAWVTGQGTEVVFGEEDEYPASGLVGMNLGGEYLFSKANTQNLVVYGAQGEAYRIVYVDMYYQNESYANLDKYYELVMLQPHEALRGEYIFMVAGYAALFLAGMAVLAVLCWLMARFVTRPTAQSLQEQAEFVAAASHELKSPLTVMRTSLSAARVAESAEETDKYHTNAEREAERMTRLVNDLLLLAGGDAGSWKLQTEAVDMDTLLIELDEQFGPVAKRAGNTLLLRLPEDAVGTVRGDSDRLRQIVSVLLDNALQYAPPGTGVVLSAKRRKGRITVDVIDHGEGIPDADKQRVFERFYRADASRSDKSHFGLGLSVARELAELHGGSLTLKDTEGGGATFRLTLPFAEV